ncbi:uncharacterized protein PITG_20880 [Phytophthora infestans T30-4]|uniref:Uncharacterized protein n=1 Tax=Phytophthora infestans (strain T30-4) TaxID=403677 RepID=D0P240_PHYIT|nr:uncharacterized protein PITG_20880 [Phytophthora infestans T30-4]EEY55466.1 hypothetical protein PITG_20880 [Phytophthora infestans T30-4]|eukprot:XP_002895628.1 hypothetical protein PITG_20880 [Phytophthora infestans T30-4]
MDEAEVMCDWCGAPVCGWKRYGFELQEAGCRLQVKLSRRRRGNRAVRQALCRLYLYLKSGSMQGDVPECVKRQLHTVWPDAEKGHRSLRCKPRPAHRELRANAL